jgi:hypothetical protein
MDKKAAVNDLARLVSGKPTQHELTHKPRAKKVLDAWLADTDDIDGEGNGEWEARLNLAIEKHLDANSFHYLIKIASSESVKDFSSALARKGAHKRHKEHREIKAAIFEWLDVNRSNYKSMDATAKAIIKQQPIAFRTAREWVGEWKKLRPAGRLSPLPVNRIHDAI